MIGTLTIRARTGREISVERVEVLTIDSESCRTSLRDEDVGLCLYVDSMWDVRLTPCRDWQAKPSYIVAVDKAANAGDAGRLVED